MSRIDDSADAQRIQEMNEADLRRKQDEKQRLREKVVERSFNEVIRERRRRENAAQLKRSERGRNETKRATESVLSHIRRSLPHRERELARRTGLAHTLQKSSAKALEDAQAAEMERAGDLLARSDEDNTYAQETTREGEERGDGAREERLAELQQASRGGGPVDADGRRKDRDQDSDSGGHEEARTEVGGVGAARSGRAAPSIPSPLIQRLVSAIYKAATADGRTHLMVELKGGRLDGVRLTVSAEEGRVRCKLSGCDRALAQGLERAKPSLSRGLARRGLQLDELTVEHR